MGLQPADVKSALSGNQVVPPVGVGHDHDDGLSTLVFRGVRVGIACALAMLVFLASGCETTEEDIDAERREYNMRLHTAYRALVDAHNDSSVSCYEVERLARAARTVADAAESRACATQLAADVAYRNALSHGSAESEYRALVAAEDWHANMKEVTAELNGPLSRKIRQRCG